MNIATMVSRALGTTTRLGLTGPVTVTRVLPGTYNPAQDSRSGDTPTSFTANAAIELDSEDAPQTGGTKPTLPRYLTLAAADCAFAPAFGQSVVIGSDPTVYRVIGVEPTEVIASLGIAAVAYRVQVAA